MAGLDPASWGARPRSPGQARRWREKNHTRSDSAL